MSSARKATAVTMRIVRVTIGGDAERARPVSRAEPSSGVSITPSYSVARQCLKSLRSMEDPSHFSVMSTFSMTTGSTGLSIAAVGTPSISSTTF